MKNDLSPSIDSTARPQIVRGISAVAHLSLRAAAAANAAHLAVDGGPEWAEAQALREAARAVMELTRAAARAARIGDEVGVSAHVCDAEEIAELVGEVLA